MYDSIIIWEYNNVGRIIMKSRTKYYIDESNIKLIFANAKLGTVSSVDKLDAGEFNTAYFVKAGGKEYVLKVAPKSDENTLTYEMGIMAREVAFYSKIANETSINTPHIYYYDDTKTIIPSEYFIMERLRSTPLNNVKLNKSERRQVYSHVGEMVAQLHSIKGDSFGYEQNGLHDDWYLALKEMVNNLISDCKKYYKKTRSANKLLYYIDKYKDILLQVRTVYTHFDIWDGNIFYANDGGGKIKLWLIDTERGFWGDGIGDFVSIEMLRDLKDKVSITSYNKCADSPLTISREELIRYNIMQAYLGLIVYTEKFFRYNKLQFKYYINIIMSKLLINKSFKALRVLQ